MSRAHTFSSLPARRGTQCACFAPNSSQDTVSVFRTQLRTFELFQTRSRVAKLWRLDLTDDISVEALHNTLSLSQPNTNTLSLCCTHSYTLVLDLMIHSPYCVPVTNCHTTPVRCLPPPGIYPSTGRPDTLRFNSDQDSWDLRAHPHHASCHHGSNPKQAQHQSTRIRSTPTLSNPFAIISSRPPRPFLLACTHLTSGSSCSRVKYMRRSAFLFRLLTHAPPFGPMPGRPLCVFTTDLISVWCRHFTTCKTRAATVVSTLQC